MLKAQKRHTSPCTRSEWDQRSCAGKGANCPVIILGTLNGRRVRRSTADFLPPHAARDLKASRDLAILWEKAGSPVRPEEYAPQPAAPVEVTTTLPTVDTAIKAFLADSRDRGNSKATLYKKQTIFERTEIQNPRYRSDALPAKTVSLTRFCNDKGIRFLQELTLPMLAEWRAAWGVDSLARHKRQCQVIGFLWFCERRGWFPAHYAEQMTRGLGRIEVKPKQTGYFMPAEYQHVLDATRRYDVKTPANGLRLRALTELMRWSGLRVRDAVTLEQHKLEYDDHNGMWRIMVYQRKTGEPVYCPIPPHVANALRTMPASQKGFGGAGERYFFWNGNGLPDTITQNWQRSYRKLFEIAALKEPDGTPKRCHAHMLRDTFSVEALLSGVSLKDVSIILGHTSIQTTERHYLPFVLARQASLNESVMQSWTRQGITK